MEVRDIISKAEGFFAPIREERQRREAEEDAGRAAHANDYWENTDFTIDAGLLPILLNIKNNSNGKLGNYVPDIYSNLFNLGIITMSKDKDGRLHVSLAPDIAQYYDSRYSDRDKFALIIGLAIAGTQPGKMFRGNQKLDMLDALSSEFANQNEYWYDRIHNIRRINGNPPMRGGDEQLQAPTKLRVSRPNPFVRKELINPTLSPEQALAAANMYSGEIAANALKRVNGDFPELEARRTDNSGFVPLTDALLLALLQEVKQRREASLEKKDKSLFGFLRRKRNKNNAVPVVTPSSDEYFAGNNY